MSAQKGKSKPEYTPEQKAEIVERVCELYETQNATIESCCAAAGISRAAFNLWTGQNGDFGERYKKAKQNQDANYWENIIRPLTKKSLQRLLEGEETEDVEIRDLADKGLLTGHTAQTVKRGKTQPNATTVIFALKGLYPDMFAERSVVNMEVTSADVETLTADKIAALEKLLADGKTDVDIQPVPGKRKGQG